MFQHLGSGVYSTGDLVNQYAAQLMATLEAYKAAQDARLVTFQV